MVREVEEDPCYCGAMEGKKAVVVSIEWSIGWVGKMGTEGTLLDLMIWVSEVDFESGFSQTT